MSKVGGYREGIEKMADAIKTRGMPAPTTPSKPEKTTPDKISAEAVPDAPDFVVEMSSLKERAQKLLDSEMFTGEELSFLEDVVAGKEV
jgi:hypothetical protein